MDTHAKPQRLQIALWLLAIAVFAAVSLTTYSAFQVGVYQDDASYIVLARSLVTSPHYGMISAPGEPTPALFPFGYPLLLAPFVYFFPDQLDALRWLSWAATLLNGALLFWKWRTFSPRASYWWGLSISTLYLVSPQTIAHSTMVMSEAVFLSFVLGAQLLFSRLKPETMRWWHILLAAVLLVFSVFIRSIGVVLVGVIFLYWLYTFRRRALIPLGAIGISMVLVTGVVVAVTVVEPRDLLPGRYIQELDQNDNTHLSHSSPQPGLGYNLEEYALGYLREAVLPAGAGQTTENLLTRLGVPWLFRGISAAVTLLIAVGWWVWYKREGVRLPLLFGVVYALTLFVWTWPLTRLLYPIQPQLVYAFLLALAALGTKITQRIPIAPLVKYAAAGLVIVLLAGMDIYMATRPGTTQARLGDVAARTAWLRTHAAPDAIVLTAFPQIDYLYGARKTVLYGRDVPVDHDLYVVIGPRVRWDNTNDERGEEIMSSMLAQMQTREKANTARLVYQDPANRIRIYQLIP